MKNRVLVVLITLHLGCASLFGWDIHAPGILSDNFTHSVQPLKQRIGLYFESALLKYESKDRGSKTADPQTFHVGESLGPMLVEAYQDAFDEFIFFEVEPTAAILRQYGIPYLTVIRIKDFRNHVTWKGQAVSLVTETAVLNSKLELLGKFESKGTSDAQKVFAKKGGPEVNLNAAIENNILAIVQYLQDSIRAGTWK